MKSRNYLLGLVLACGIALTVQSCGPAYISVEPMRPVIVRSPSPYYGAVWIDGGWNSRGGYYHQGAWGRPRQGQTYYEGRWNHGARGYSYERGRWR